MMISLAELHFTTVFTLFILIIDLIVRLLTKENESIANVTNFGGVQIMVELNVLVFRFS